MSHLVRTSEFTEEAEEVIAIPPPEQRSMDVPEGVFSNRKGFIILGKKCVKLGYETRLTYARGYVITKKVPTLRHHLLLRIRGPVEGGMTTVAGASWEAPAQPEDDPWAVDYKTHGALIYALPGKFGNKELEQWLADPTHDPRDPKETP